MKRESLARLSLFIWVPALLRYYLSVTYITDIKEESIHN